MNSLGKRSLDVITRNVFQHICGLGVHHHSLPMTQYKREAVLKLCLDSRGLLITSWGNQDSYCVFHGPNCLAKSLTHSDKYLKLVSHFPSEHGLPKVVRSGISSVHTVPGRWKSLQREDLWLISGRTLVDGITTVTSLKHTTDLVANGFTSIKPL